MLGILVALSYRSLHHALFSFALLPLDISSDNVFIVRRSLFRFFCRFSFAITIILYAKVASSDLILFSHIEQIVVSFLNSSEIRSTI